MGNDLLDRSSICSLWILHEGFCSYSGGLLIILLGTVKGMTRQ